MRHLVLPSFQSPGDVVMLTAAVRDLHAAHPGQFATDVRTSADGLWLHNPHITRLEERESGVKVLEMHYPLIHHSNQRPYHFIHGYAQYLEEQLGSTADPFIKQKTYNMIAQQIETGMMAEVKENFAFKVIDPPLAPDKKIKPKRVQMVMLSLIVALFVGVFAAFFREYIEKIRGV